MPAEVGATRRSDARDNRARILAAARAAGPSAPIRVIAERAGVGAATVHRHFRTKAALLAEAHADQAAPCSTIMDEGLADADPWRGFALVVEKLMARAAPVRVAGTAAEERERSLGRLLELVRRAKDAGELRRDLVLEDLVLALMANQGIRAGSPEMRAAASRRFAALLLQSFRAEPVPAALPPAVRLPVFPVEVRRPG